MSRLQKKCFLASTGVHLLLVLILFVGPGFLSKPTRQDDVRTLTMISPDILTDSQFYNNGEAPRASARQPPVPASPAPAPKADNAPAPEPVSETRSSRRTEAVELKEHTPRLPDVSLTKVTRPTSSKQTSTTSTDDSRQKQAAEANRRAQAALSQALREMREGVSGVSKVSDFNGSDGVGASYAPYSAWVKTVYENAWIIPADTTSDDAITRVSVTVASDGSILSSRIVNPSGDAQMDASVQRALDRVARNGIGRPFPEGAKDKERTYIIPFNLKIKKGTA